MWKHRLEITGFPSFFWQHLVGGWWQLRTSARENIKYWYQNSSPCLKSLNINDGKHLLSLPNNNITFKCFTVDVFPSYIMFWRAFRFTDLIFNFIFSLLGRHLTLVIDWPAALHLVHRASSQPHPPLCIPPLWGEHPFKKLRIIQIKISFCYTSSCHATFAGVWISGNTTHHKVRLNEAEKSAP